MNTDEKQRQNTMYKVRQSDRQTDRRVNVL